MHALFPNGTFETRRRAIHRVWRAAILLLIGVFLLLPSAASANLALQAGPPLPPRQLEPPHMSYVSPPSVTFRWAPTEGAAKYTLVIYREDNLSEDDRIEVEVTGATTYTHTGLTPGYTYVWFVEVDFATSGSNQDFFEFTLSDTPLAPRAPESIFTADGNHIEEIAISWYKSYRTAYYLLQKRAPGSTNFTDLARVGQEREFVDREGQPGVHNEYRVLACNHVGCSEPSPIDEGWLGVCEPVAAPVLVSPPEGTEIMIHRQSPWYTLEWEPVEGVRSHILRILDRDWERVVFQTELEYEGADSYEVDSVVGNLAWYVIATNPVVGCPNSPPSEVREYTARYFPPPEVPTDVNASDGTYPDRVVITWEQPPSESLLEEWVVFRSTTPDLDDAVRIGAASSEPTFTDSEVTPGVTYHYWVNACSHADGCSARSEPDTGYAGGSTVELDQAVFVPVINQ